MEPAPLFCVSAPVADALPAEPVREAEAEPLADPPVAFAVPLAEPVAEEPAAAPVAEGREPNSCADE